MPDQPVSPYGYPAAEAAPGRDRKRRRWLWPVGGLLLVGLLATAAVVVVRTVSVLRGAGDSELGQAELQLQSTAYPGAVDVRLRRSGNCETSQENARVVDVDLSCLQVELSPTGQFGAQFMLESNKHGRIGEVPAFGEANPAASAVVLLSLVTTDSTDQPQCAKGLCFGPATSLTAEVDGVPAEDDGGMHFTGSQSLTYTLKQGDSVTLTGTATTAPSQGDLDTTRDGLFAVAYAAHRPGTVGLTYTVIGVHPFGSGELDAERVAGALREVGEG